MTVTSHRSGDAYHVAAVEIRSSNPTRFVPQLRQLPRLRWLIVPYLSDEKVANLQPLLPDMIVDNHVEE